MKNYFDLSGRVAVVTGCSTGLGVQMAKALANQGCSIVAVARRQNLIDEVAVQIKEEYGVETLAVRCDITDTDMVNAMVDTVMEKFGRIDVLINNAGTGAVAPAEDITDDQFANEMNIDLFGSFKVAREVAKKAMIPAKYGSLSCGQGRCRQFDQSSGGRVGQVRHHRQCDLSGLLLYAADKGNVGFRFLPAECKDDDPGRKIWQ